MYRSLFILVYLTDIRDTVKYKEVMKQYQLGPNGGIVTSLNLFATRFDQVLVATSVLYTFLHFAYQLLVGFPGYV